MAVVVYMPSRPSDTQVHGLFAIDRHQRTFIVVVDGQCVRYNETCQSCTFYIQLAPDDKDAEHINIIVPW